MREGCNCDRDDDMKDERDSVGGALEIEDGVDTDVVFSSIVNVVLREAKRFLHRTNYYKCLSTQ